MVIRSPEGPWRENFPASSGSSLDFESPCHLLSKDESAIFFVFPPRAVAENLLPTRYMASKGFAVRWAMHVCIETIIDQEGVVSASSPSLTRVSHTVSHNPGHAF